MLKPTGWLTHGWFIGQAVARKCGNRMWKLRFKYEVCGSRRGLEWEWEWEWEWE